MCNCIETIKEQMLKNMTEQKGFTEVIDEPFFVNYAIYPVVKPYFPIKGAYMEGKRKRKFEVSFYPTFCLFCGEKYEEESE